MTSNSWQDKISNHIQLGGIETSVLNNGLGNGTRIAWINTGASLRYKVVLDRGMDIADAFFNEHSLAWISHSGVTAGERFSNQGIDWLRTFGGGLLTTCGLTHVGGPERDVYGSRGLHDEISNLPAELESVIQPDPMSGKMDMSITGKIKQPQVFGPSLELKRTISATLGKATIRISDEVTNRGNTAAPHMLLYHCNFGWPLADEGSRLLWKGDWKPGNDASAKIFREGNSFRVCPPVMKEHDGGGEAVAFIRPSDEQCICGLYNEQIGVALTLSFQKEQLPWLINWQHWGKREYVTALEPATHPPIGQAKARAEESLIWLQPGETRQYDLELEILHDDEKIAAFVKNYNL